MYYMDMSFICITLVTLIDQTSLLRLLIWTRMKAKILIPRYNDAYTFEGSLFKSPCFLL